MIIQIPRDASLDRSSIPATDDGPHLSLQSVSITPVELRPAELVLPLKDWFDRQQNDPTPSKEQLTALAETTGLSIQLVNSLNKLINYYN